MEKIAGRLGSDWRLIQPIVEVMDLVSAVVGMKQAETASKVQYAVAKKLLDTQRMQGDAAIKLLQAAANTGSTAGDQLTAAATGLGGQLDVLG